jgi:hypothetical protein
VFLPLFRIRKQKRLNENSRSGFPSQLFFALFRCRDSGQSHRRRRFNPGDSQTNQREYEEGKRVTPGFNDSHVRFLDGGMGLASVQLRDARMPEEFRDCICDFAAKLSKGRSIRSFRHARFGLRWDHNVRPKPILKANLFSGASSVAGGGLV